MKTFKTLLRIPSEILRTFYNSYAFLKIIYIGIIFFSIRNVFSESDFLVRAIFFLMMIIFLTLLGNSKRMSIWTQLIYDKIQKQAWKNYFQFCIYGIIGLSIINIAITLFFNTKQHDLYKIMDWITLLSITGLISYLLFNVKNPHIKEDGLLTQIFDQHTNVDFIKFMNLLNQLFFLKGADRNNNKHRGLLNSLFSDFIKISSSSLRSQKSQIGEETTDSDFVKKMLSALDREVEKESNHIYEKYELILSDFINRFRIKGIQLAPKENPQLKILCFLYFCLLKEEINNLSVPIQLENKSAINSLKEKLIKFITI